MPIVTSKDHIRTPARRSVTLHAGLCYSSRAEVLIALHCHLLGACWLIIKLHANTFQNVAKAESYQTDLIYPNNFFLPIIFSINYTNNHIYLIIFCINNSFFPPDFYSIYFDSSTNNLCPKFYCHYN